MSSELVAQVLEQYDREIEWARANGANLELHDRAYNVGQLRALEWARAVLERHALARGELPTATRG